MCCARRQATHPLLIITRCLHGTSGGQSSGLSQGYTPLCVGTSDGLRWAHIRLLGVADGGQSQYAAPGSAP